MKAWEAARLARMVDEREARREGKRTHSRATHALVQFGAGLAPGNHVPCEVLGRDKESGRLVVQVVGCEPHEVKAPRAGKVVMPSHDGPRWQWRPGTVHKYDECDECRSRRGR